MQEAYVNRYWEEMVSFTRSLFNSTFKTNPYLERAMMTGITRVSKESVFSDLNNLEVVTTTSEKYAKYFGFTEGEVFAALIWSLLLASGYLKVEDAKFDRKSGKTKYKLSLTNQEVQFMFLQMVELREQYIISSNKESGFGRYDIMLEPKRAGDDALIIEFKVVHTKRGETLESAVVAALAQIEEKKYDALLTAKGISKSRIRKYGFAFQGKTVLIGS